MKPLPPTSPRTCNNARKFNRDLDAWWDQTKDLIAKAEDVHGIAIGRIVVNVDRDGGMRFEWEDR